MGSGSQQDGTEDRMMKRSVLPTAALTCLLMIAAFASAQDGAANAPPQRGERRVPTVTVSGESEVSVSPDRAVVTFGNTARGDTAASVQDSVNTTMQRIIQAVRALDVNEKYITTSGITLSPVYTNVGPQPDAREPRVTGFEARNTISVRLDDTARVGPVLDAAVKAGANEVQGVSFDLKDETEARSRALRQAVQNARVKADAIAAGLGMRVANIVEAAESGTQTVRPMMLGRAMPMAMEGAASPVQPGQVQVRGNVTVVYSLSPGDKPLP
jgi:uncharacterized protein YggE